jgi:bifunctional non-homologous end joining protein LigD
MHIEVDGRWIALSNLDRVLWPAAGFTKRQMVEYYRAVGSVLVPHLAGRAVTLGRLPEGVDGPGWYQSNCRGQPAWMRTAPMGRPGRQQRYCVVDDLAGLLWVANQGTIELHPFLARVEEPERPLVMVFDLDPGAPADLAEACRVGRWLRDALTARGLGSFPKVSGAKGLHVYVPLNTPCTYADTKAFARRLAADLARTHPDRVIDRNPKELRTGKVFVDWSQNDPMKSTVAPYSLRASRTPKGSAPVGWEEVERCAETGDAEPLRFPPHAVLERVERLGDLFAPVLGLSQALPG